MRSVVRSTFPGFTDAFEGTVPHMYTDNVGLVTVARGNLIDPGQRRLFPDAPAVGSNPYQAMLLPFVCPTSPLRSLARTYASRDAIAAEFQTVKGAWPNVQSVACKGITRLRLLPEAIDELTFTKLDQLWKDGLDTYPGADDWCADAQLGLCSMMWAMGSRFFFPNFRKAVNTGDWVVAAGPPGDANAILTCRGQAWMRDGTAGQLTASINPGLRPRNLANKVLFTNAQWSTDPDTLYYPRALAAP